jgi:hypothetical protein
MQKPQPPREPLTAAEWQAYMAALTDWERAGDLTPQRRVCPDCHGTALSPYPDDGGCCPHCWGGYVR